MLDLLIDDASKFIARHPSHARAYEARGLLRLFRGNGVDAEFDFLESRRLNPALKAEIEAAAGRARALLRAASKEP